MTSLTSPNSVFKHATSNLYTINSRLVNSMNVSTENINRIQTLQKYRLFLHDLIELETNPVELKRLGYVSTLLEFQLQKLWGFKLNRYKHITSTPKCKCLVILKEMCGEYGQYVDINPICPLHGKK